MELLDTVWRNEEPGVMYQWDATFGWDQGKQWDGYDTVWTDEEDD